MQLAGALKWWDALRSHP